MNLLLSYYVLYCKPIPGSYSLIAFKIHDS